MRALIISANGFADSELRFPDEGIAVDGNLITARKPADLPYFMHAVMAAPGLSPGA